MGVLSHTLWFASGRHHWSRGCTLDSVPYGHMLGLRGPRSPGPHFLPRSCVCRGGAPPRRAGRCAVRAAGSPRSSVQPLPTGPLLSGLRFLIWNW